MLSPGRCSWTLRRLLAGVCTALTAYRIPLLWRRSLDSLDVVRMIDLDADSVILWTGKAKKYIRPDLSKRHLQAPPFERSRPGDFLPHNLNASLIGSP